MKRSAKPAVSKLEFPEQSNKSSVSSLQCLREQYGMSTGPTTFSESWKPQKVIERSVFGPLSHGRRFQFGTWDIEVEPILDSDGKIAGYSDHISMIGCYDGESYSNFSRWEDFLNHVCTPKYSGYRFFAHNGGRYDSNALFDYVRVNRPDLQFSFYCSGSCVVSLTFRKGEYTWKFCDSYRLLDASLKQLTTEFDVEHKKANLVEAMKGGWETELRYNRTDCIGLYEVLTRLFSEFSAQAETVASFAVQVFQLHFLKRKLCKPSRKVEDFIRQAYFGGRCEVYRWDPAEVQKYDVNSLYPYAMLGPVPTDYTGWSSRLPDDDREIGFYEAEVRYPECYLPRLPVVIGKRLFFPTGRFTGHFTSIELREAINDHAAVKILSGVLFRTEPVFREFAERLFKRRIEAKTAGNLAVDWVCKKILNSCYGKFGMRRVQRSYCSDPGTERLHAMIEELADLDPDQLERRNPRIWPVGFPGSGIAYYDRESRASCILPHITCAITSRARTVIHGYLTTAKEIWYTDTDSIFTDRKLETGPNLGNLKLEGNGRFEPFGLKEYKFSDEYNLKGVSIKRTDPNTGEKTVHPEIAEQYLANEEISFERRAGFLESLRSDELTFRSLTSVKQRRPRIEKRARQGSDTRPWNAEEVMEYSKYFTTKHGKRVYAKTFGLNAFHFKGSKPKTFEDSLLQAVKSLGGIDPAKLAKMRGSEWREMLPVAIWMQVIRTDSGNGLDSIVRELQSMGYLYDEDTLLTALCNEKTRNAGLQMEIEDDIWERRDASENL